MTEQKPLTSAEDFAAFNRLAFQQPALLSEALTHRSYINEHPDVERDNERLEFMGDTIIAFVVTEALFEQFPNMREGELTRLRAAVVRAEALAALAREARIGEVLRMARGEESSGGRTRVNLLADAFEAVVGALYVDQGLAEARRWLLPRLQPQIDEVLRRSNNKDARSLLQELAQERFGITPRYEVLSATGPEHDKHFTVAALIGDRQVATGSGRSKQLAAQDAARSALADLS